MDADFPWLAYGWRLLQGSGVTLAISLAAMLVSLAGGVLLGVLMTLPNRLLHFVCRAYLEFIRFMPVLVLLYICYFGFAAWFGWHWQAYSVCILVFSLWGIAEMGDLVRGALVSIDPHQRETALATTALAALIGVVDVVKVAQQIIELHPWASFLIYGILFMLYFLLCYPLSLLAARLEREA